MRHRGGGAPPSPSGMGRISSRVGSPILASCNVLLVGGERGGAECGGHLGGGDSMPYSVIGPRDESALPPPINFSAPEYQE